MTLPNDRTKETMRNTEFGELKVKWTRRQGAHNPIIVELYHIPSSRTEGFFLHVNEGKVKFEARGITGDIILEREFPSLEEARDYIDSIVVESFAEGISKAIAREQKTKCIEAEVEAFFNTQNPEP